VSKHPIELLLGVRADADEATLLGLDRSGAGSIAAIDNALRTRLAFVYQHPQRHDTDMHAVLHALRRAAATLKTRVAHQRHASQKAGIQLTEFDRSVLAVLVAYGGWNAASRSRLVGLAAAQGVSVMGLIRVIRGLSDYAHSGGPALSMEQISSASQRASMQPTSRWIDNVQLLERFLPELQEPSTKATIKLSVFFALITLLVGLLALRLLMPESLPRSTEQVQQPVMVPVDEDATRTETPEQTSEYADRPIRPMPMATPLAMRGEARPGAAVEARSVLERELEELAAIGRRMSLASDPTEASFRSWDEAINLLATAWLLLDVSQVRQVEQAIVIALLQTAGRPDVSDRLLRPLTPQVGVLAESLDLPRGVFKTRMLGTLATHEQLSPVIRQRAARLLDVALRAVAPASGWDAHAASHAWLAEVLASLIDDVAIHADAADRWELWLVVQQRLYDAQQFNANLMDAATRLLHRHRNLAVSNEARRVLARLLLEADFRWAIVYDTLADWYDDQSTISSQQLYAISTILFKLDRYPGMDEQLIVSPEADATQRADRFTRLSRVWPERFTSTRTEAASALQIDPDRALYWLDLYQRLHDRPVEPSDRGWLVSTWHTAMLNTAAAALATGEVNLAQRTMQQLESALQGTVPSPQLPSAQSQGPQRAAHGDSWAHRYEEARRNSDEKLALLQSLRTSLRRGNDLVPEDAAIFVREVYRGTPVQVRTLAQSILVEQLSFGRNVALEMLDQLPDAGRSPALADVLQQYTGSLLPDSSDPDWAYFTRLAVLEHVLSLWPNDQQFIDTLASELGRTYAVQTSLIARSPQREHMAVRPEVSAQSLLEAWSRATRSMPQTSTTTRVLDDLTRRHVIREQLASGPIQRFVARQLGIMDLLAHSLTIEQPQRAHEVRETLHQSTRHRVSINHALAQALEAERLMSQLWKWRMGLDVSMLETVHDEQEEDDA